MAESKIKTLSTGRIVSLVMAAVLVAAVTILLIQNISLRNQVAESLETEEELTAEIDNVEQQMKDLEFAMRDQELELDKKEQMLKQKEALVAEQEEKIAALLAKNRISQQEAERLRGRVEQLEYYVKKYEGQIAELKQEIAERDQQIASLEGELGKTKDINDSLKTVDIAKSIKIEGGKKLTAHTFQFFRKKQSGALVEETSFRASQMDAIKICMVVAANNLTSKGNKDVYLRIMNPSGKLVKDDTQSGYFKYSREDMQYTTKGEMDYQGEKTSVCMEFAQPKGYEYEGGQYKVITYCEDRIIGNAEFEVK